MASEAVEDNFERNKPSNSSDPDNSPEASQSTELRQRRSPGWDAATTTTNSSSGTGNTSLSSSSQNAERVAENNANSGPQIAPEPPQIPLQHNNIPVHHHQDPQRHHQIRIHLRVNLNYVIAIVLIAVYAYTYFEIEHEINVRSKPLVPHSVGYVYKQPEDSASDDIKSHDSSVNEELDYLTKTLQGDDNPNIPSEYQLQSKYLSHILSNLNEMVRKFEVSNNITKPLGGIVELRTQEKDDKPDYLKRLTDIVDELKVAKKKKKRAAEAEAAKDTLDTDAEKQKNEFTKLLLEQMYEQYDEDIVNERPEPGETEAMYSFDDGNDHDSMEENDDIAKPRKEIAQIAKLMEKLKRVDYKEEPRRTNMFGRDIDERPNEDEGQVFALQLTQKILQVKKAEAENNIDVPLKHHSFQEDADEKDEIKVDYVKHSFDDDPDDIELYDAEIAKSVKYENVQVREFLEEEPTSSTSSEEVKNESLDPATQKVLEILNDFYQGMKEAATLVPQDGDLQLVYVDKVFAGLEEKFRKKQSESNPTFDHQDKFDEDLSDDIIAEGLLCLFKLKLWTRLEDEKYFRRQKEVMSRMESKYPMFKTMFLIQQLNEIMEDPELFDIPWEVLIPKNVKSLQDLSGKKKAMIGFISALKKDYASREAHLRYLEQLAEL